MKRYYFRLYHTWDTEDGDNVWTTASSWEEAEREIRSEYHSIHKLVRMREE